MDADLKSAYDQSIALRGDGTFFEVMGNNMDLYHWYIDRFYKELFYAKRIDQPIKELLRFRLSTIHGCKFCNQGNREEALSQGITPEQINHIHDYENGPFEEDQKAILRLADVMALDNPNGTLTASLYAQLNKYFSPGAILELGMIMGILSGVAKFIFAYDLVEKEDYCPFIQSGE